MSKIYPADTTVRLIGAPVQGVSCLITGTNTQADTTIPSAVDVNNTLLMFSGSSHNGSQLGSMGRVTLLNSTTIRANRTSNTNATTRVGVSVIQFAQGVLKRPIQYGTITISAGASSNTAAITAVATANAEVVFLGSCHDTNDYTLKADVALTGAAVVTATRGGIVGTTVVSFAVIEFNPSYVVGKATFTVGNQTSNTEYMPVTPSAPINISKSLVFWQGNRTTAAINTTRRIIITSDSQAIAQHIAGVFTDAYTNRVSAIQLAAGLVTNQLYIPLTATTLNTTIPALADYRRTAVNYMGTVGNGDDYVDSASGYVTSNTNFQTLGTQSAGMPEGFTLTQFA
jgi:hypothetical protein